MFLCSSGPFVRGLLPLDRCSSSLYVKDSMHWEQGEALQEVRRWRSREIRREGEYDSVFYLVSRFCTKASRPLVAVLRMPFCRGGAQPKSFPGIPSAIPDQAQRSKVSW